jgi:predicted unusual protein kinase regulating ubiquinone biosynthesis (AarF/ABC1/UbiB family)
VVVDNLALVLPSTLILERVMLQYSSETITVTPWVHGIQIYDRALKEEYFLNLSDLRAIYLAIVNHTEKHAITRDDSAVLEGQG